MKGSDVYNEERTTANVEVKVARTLKTWMTLNMRPWFVLLLLLDEPLTK